MSFPGLLPAAASVPDAPAGPATLLPLLGHTLHWTLTFGGLLALLALLVASRPGRATPVRRPAEVRRRQLALLASATASRAGRPATRGAGSGFPCCSTAAPAAAGRARRCVRRRPHVAPRRRRQQCGGRGRARGSRPRAPAGGSARRRLLRGLGAGPARVGRRGDARGADPSAAPRRAGGQRRRGRDLAGLAHRGAAGRTGRGRGGGPVGPGRDCVGGRGDRRGVLGPEFWAIHGHRRYMPWISCVGQRRHGGGCWRPWP